jgi:hypothetical protein
VRLDPEYGKTSFFYKDPLGNEKTITMTLIVHANYFSINQRKDVIMFSAEATTDTLGRELVMGMDFSTLGVEAIGERRDPWARDVSYKDSTTLGEMFTKTKYMKYDMLARIVQRENKGIQNTDVVACFANGGTKELRIGKRKYRISNSDYLGSRKI